MRSKTTKFILFLTVTLMGLSTVFPVFAEYTEYLTECAISNLTEVFGYSEEAAQKFVFFDCGDGHFDFWQDEMHSEWMYQLTYDVGTGKVTSGSTPFHSDFSPYYPGENTVRRVVNAFTANDWLHHWNDDSIAAFEAEVTRWDDVHMTEFLKNGLAQKSITAEEAITEFFFSCYGSKEYWTLPTVQWLAELTGNSDVESHKPEKNEDGVTHLTSDSASSEVRYFTDQIPIDLPMDDLIANDWKPYAGVIWETKVNQGNDKIRSDVFLVCKRYGEYSVTLFWQNNGEDWQKVYCGTKMISPGAYFELEADLLYNNPFLSLTYETENEEKVRANLILLDGKCYLRDCTFTDNHTGYCFYLQHSDRADTNAWDWKEIIDGVSQSGVISCSVTDEYAAMSLSELPRGEKDLQEWQQEVIPDGYVMIRGVHLRKEKSSHSADLGLFNAGAIVQFLGKEDGNPYYWAHVRIGDLEGYMAGNYICFDELGEKGYYFDALLPVVKAMGNTSLKRGRGLFDGTVADIEAGTKMHVLAEYDDWYYVVVPQETIQARMDIYGTYGYIAKDQVESSTIFDLE